MKKRKNQELLNQLIKENSCIWGIYKLIHSGFINEDIENIKQLKIDEDDFSELRHLVEKLKLNIEVISYQGGQYLFEEGILIFSKDPKGFCKSFTYDSNGNLIKFEASNGLWRTQEYDSNGNWIKVEHSNGVWETRKFDSEGNLIESKSSDGICETWDYHSLGKTHRHETSNGLVNIWEYNLKGQKTKHTDSTGFWET